MRLGILTGGGDCPGLNAVIRAVVLHGGRRWNDEVVGFRDGWRGVIDDEGFVIAPERASRILSRGGTILGTSRIQPYTTADGPRRAVEALQRRGVEGLIVVGGEGTLSVANRLHRDHGVRLVGVPKTIDNDVGVTQLTFGFETAVQTATDAIDRLHTTAESHNRVMVVEVMGRHAGHVALWAGIAGGAAAILVPERPFDIAAVSGDLQRLHEGGTRSSVVVVAEGARPMAGTLEIPEPGVDEYGHARLGGIGAIVASEIEARTALETRVTVLGHVQRGGTPTAFDRVLCTSFGVAAVDATHEGAFGQMVAVRGGGLALVPLAEATAALKPIPADLWQVAQACLS
ncbi:MAG: 6-phosphofructokinase [Acidimicrobiia bacterium]|nr:6-phosphofructokinase [Acidimicrobiia bacterium]